jgi:hypothetical protein
LTDIFHEVEEDVRRERLEQLWKNYGDFIIAGAALLVMAAAAFQLWRVYEQRQRLQASESYMAAQILMESGQAGEAAAMFAKLAQTAPGGYAELSLMQQADALYASGNTDRAVDLYRQVAMKSDPLLGPAARIRIAWATLETTPRDQIATLLASLTDPASAWHPFASEILAYADYHSGAMAQAQREFKALSTDHDAPPGVRQRANAMANFIAAGGARDFGTVPEPAMIPPANASQPNVPQRGVKPGITAGSK